MKLHFSETIFNFLKNDESIVIACSGGGDSVALFFNVRNLFPDAKVHLLHFNHNLRKSAQKDENLVKSFANFPNVNVHVGYWNHQNLQGNIQQLGRIARYKFFEEKCEELGIYKLLIAHTETDLLENFFMRLGRGSGLTGLTSMKEVSTWGALQLYRPFLKVSREEIRKYLKEKKIKWVEDPSNLKTKFLRIRVRNLLNKLSKIGLEKKAISSSILSLGKAQDSLDFYVTKDFLTYWNNSEKNFDAKAFFNMNEDIQERIIDKILKSYFPNEMTPRTTKKRRLCEALVVGKKASLGGVTFFVEKDVIQTQKEFSKIDL